VIVEPRGSPGPAADRTLDTGTRIAGLGALAALGPIHRPELLTPSLLGITAVVLAPVRLLVVSALGKWLGYVRGPSDLRRVRRARPAQSLPERDPP
jgi:hypothetical protein